MPYKGSRLVARSVDAPTVIPSFEKIFDRAVGLAQHRHTVRYCVALLASVGVLHASVLSAAVDERGAAAAIGADTFARCGRELTRPGARAYELSHMRTNTMPQSMFAAPEMLTPQPTRGLPHTRQAFNGDALAGASGAQGTQVDALGLFGDLATAWTGAPPYPTEAVTYYGGLKQADVKPTPGSPLLRLGIDKAPPIVTSGVLLDARGIIGHGSAMRPGDEISAADLRRMLAAEGLAKRGLLAGDVVYIYTGHEEYWRDPDDHRYMSGAPGLSADAARYLAAHKVAMVGTDTPFTDAVFGKDSPAKSAPKDLPWATHDQNLVRGGVLQMQNGHLAELAHDRVWLSCTMVLPLRQQGATGSPVRPVSIGAPQLAAKLGAPRR